MRSLRSRLILSHILPLLIVIPLVGVSLIYAIETQVLLKNVSEELTRQAAQVAEAAHGREGIWQDAAEAQAFLESLNLPGSVMLLNPSGQLLAFSGPAGAFGPGQVIAVGDTALTPGSEHPAPLISSLTLRNTTEIWVPVQGQDRQIVGIVRIHQQLADVYRRFEQLRYLIVGILGIELLLGLLIGLVLALKLEKSLQQVAQAILSVATGRDLTMLPEKGPEEILTVLRAFNTMTRRLQEAQDMRRRLLANLVHELGRPLGAVRSAVGALLNGADQDPALRQELLTGIDSQLQRLEPLLDNLAQLHDTLLDIPRLKRRPVALAPWLSEVLSLWRAAAQEKNLRWSVSIPDSLPTLDIDPDRLAQAIGNLVSNAIKFTPPEGAVSIAVARQDGHLRIAVQDSGPGIAPEEQQRIFEPFYRGNKRFAQGMGLGLTIARDLVAAHAGRIEVNSQPGQGSQFTICLPCGD
jgi:signal transduction histidine kinase